MSSRGFNKVITLGTLTKDPELRHSNSGVSYLYFDLACNYSVKDSNGNYQDAVDYIPFTVFGKTAEFIDKFCVKGSQLFIEGKLKRNKRQDKNGNDIYETQVIAQDIRFAGGKRKDGGNSGNSGGQSFYQQNSNYSQGNTNGSDPFSSIDNYEPSGEAYIPF